MPMNKHSLFKSLKKNQLIGQETIEDLISNNTFVSPLIRERENRILIDDGRVLTEQAIISNINHNIFELNTTLINTSQMYFQQITEAMNEFQFTFNDLISTIQLIFTNLSQNFISAFFTVIKERNKNFFS
jgi:hypothetical protein